MARSCLAISADFVGEAVPMLSQFVRIVGSQVAPEGQIAFIIEGETVPDVPRVIATIKKAADAGKTTASISIEFQETKDAY